MRIVCASKQCLSGAAAKINDGAINRHTITP
jgi:hypothetical protein